MSKFLAERKKVSFNENVPKETKKSGPKDNSSKKIPLEKKEVFETKLYEYFGNKNSIDKPLFSDDNLLWVAQSFFNEMGILRHQIESYNHFISVLLPKIIEENAILEIDGGEDKKIILEFSNPIFDMPRYTENDNESKLLYPQEAKDRDATYSSALYVDILKTEKVVLKPTEFKKKSKKNIAESQPLDIEKVWSETKVSYRKQLLAKVPVMVGSNLCNLSKYNKDFTEMVKRYEDPYDQGGYFIVNGGMKVVISQERTSFNRVYTFEKNKKTSKFEIYSEVRSSATGGAHTTTTQVGITKDNRILANLPYIPPTTGIPIGIVFKALGIDKEKDILTLIFYSLGEDMDTIVKTIDNREITKKEILIEMLNIIIPNLEHTSACKSQDNALFYIGKLGKKYITNEESEKAEESIADELLAELLENSKKKDNKKSSKADAITFATNILKNELFPHLGTDFLVKRYYLGYIIYKFLCVKLKIKQQDDRDHYANKRADTVGVLLHNLFYTSFKRYRNECKMRSEVLFKKGNILVNPIMFLLPKTITKQLNNCLSTGNWCGYKNIHTKKNGVSQVYEIFNYSSRLSNARKFSTPIGENNTKLIPPRRLHNSQYYLMCPFETPEGKHTGLVKNISLNTYITIGYEQKDMIQILEKIGFLPITEDVLKLKYTKIFINGQWLGFVKESLEFVSKLRCMKLHNNINIETGIVYDDVLNEIRISTDSGRLSRPLLVVKNNKLVLDSETLKKVSLGQITFTELCSMGMVELIDPDEAEFILLAERPCDLIEKSSKVYTHCMTDPSLIFGIAACQTPFPNHNQSPRIVYHCAQCKQAVGIPNLNMDFIMNGSYHILHYPQKPLVKTQASNLIKTNELPTGINANIMIAPYRGFNQEDSIIIKRSFVQRGGFQTSHMTHYSAEIKKDKKQTLDIPNTETCVGFKGGNTDFLSRTIIEDNDLNKNYYVNVIERSVAPSIYGYSGECRQNKKGSSLESIKFNKQLDKNSKVPYGVIQVGSIVKHGDILIGITQEIESENGKSKLNQSITFDADDYGLVRKVQWGRNANGYRYVKVKVVSLKIPILGDKFSSRHGRFGCCRY